MTTVYYHFHNGHERYGSHRPIVDGRTYKVRGQPILCSQGLHASRRLIDALRYAPVDADKVSLVTLAGIVLHDTDKSVATERTVLRTIDMTHILHDFACWCAEQALKAEHKAGREPDKRCWEAIRVKRQWLDGKATDEVLAAAAAAAEEAAASARAAAAAREEAAAAQAAAAAREAVAAAQAAAVAAAASAREAVAAAASAALAASGWAASGFSRGAAVVVAARAAVTAAARASARASQNRKLTSMLRKAMAA